MSFPMYYRKDPLNLLSLNGGIESQCNIRNKESQLIQLAQKEQTNKTTLYNLKTKEEDRDNLRNMITESMKKGIFPPSLTLVKHMESEISTILNNIYKDLQKISNLSVFLMTKQICYKFYLLYPYEMRAPQYIVPAAFLLSSRIIDENYNNFVTEQLVKFYFENKESLFQEKDIILQTLSPYMASLKDPIKIMTDICHQQNKKYALTEAYKVIQEMEPTKFQTMIPYDIADLAIHIALDNMKKANSKPMANMIAKESDKHSISEQIYHKVGHTSTRQKESFDQDQNNKLISTLETTYCVSQNFSTEPKKLIDKVEKLKDDTESKGQLSPKLHKDKLQDKCTTALNKSDVNSKNLQKINKPVNLSQESNNQTNAEKQGHQQNSKPVLKNSEQPYICKICNVNFKFSKKKYSKHISRCGKRGKFRFKCSCGISFPRKISLKRHISLKGQNCVPLYTK